MGRGSLKQPKYSRLFWLKVSIFQISEFFSLVF
ncbi:hypothetical protein MTR67_019717 [Solanum verrucosum]|uniref:Uncharacterized protein n=1 Tax=Solanum verrucosum TaxID=315347 RepID=A0AAF0TMV6_SOLVR|nr:hypothetical protein MTR67_019717 [Solanum verrucosum]